MRDQLYPAVDLLLGRLSERRDDIAQDMAATLRREVPAYPATGGELATLQDHCHQQVSAFLEVVRTGRVPTDHAVDFVRDAEPATGSSWRSCYAATAATPGR
jgi:hypothetical protein